MFLLAVKRPSSYASNCQLSICSFLGASCRGLGSTYNKGRVLKEISREVAFPTPPKKEMKSHSAYIELGKCRKVELFNVCMSLHVASYLSLHQLVRIWRIGTSSTELAKLAIFSAFAGTLGVVPICIISKNNVIQYPFIPCCNHVFCCSFSWGIIKIRGVLFYEVFLMFISNR